MKCSFLFVVKNVYVLEFNNCVCEFDKNENKNLTKKNKQIKWKMPVVSSNKCTGLYISKTIIRKAKLRTKDTGLLKLFY